ncbi:DNA primase [Candidatus Oleimmundimicrobium sp.]|uniref:DNA primase n=1 Tax=Candidatus Oleimmundimicrobium sp. TaxID=3060597 RepID=UPI00271B70F6|nr:DNA primase [Candidatus Oleimmundimicrobium sp.]MDO8885479.1 DNA primase [Candidatus Oleimmundimicrobium sp.]
MFGHIKEEDINEIRERNDLVEVVSGYVNLKKTGRLFKGLCPFHKEKTPSFIVDPIKQLYHCFGCGEGGNVYNFLMKIENIDFPEAVQMLAEKANYSIHYEQTSDFKAVSHKEKMYSINELAQKLYNYDLFKTTEGERARDYLKKRGFQEKTFNDFKLGFASTDGKRILKFLMEKGYDLQELVDVGLVVKGERGPHDLFRNRIIFPILNLRGKPIAFGGRVVGQGLPKYINSPETTIFHKSSTLYNQSLAKSEIVKLNYALVVEGYTDVILLYQAGIKNVVATLGTAFTSDHLHLLSRFTNKVVLLFDADKAGMAAAERGLNLFGQSKVDIFVVSLPTGKDPADFIISEGKDAFKERLDSAIPLIEFCINQVLQKYNLKKPLEKARAADEAVGIIARLENFVLKEDYLKELGDKLNISYDSLLAQLKKIKRKGFESKESIVNVSLDVQTKCEKEALKFILQYPDEVSRYLSKISEKYFIFPPYRDLLNFLKGLPKESINYANLINLISEEKLINLVTALALEPINIDADNCNKYFLDILIRLKDFHIERQINKLREKLKESEKEKLTSNTETIDLIFNELNELEKVRRKLKQQI